MSSGNIGPRFAFYGPLPPGSNKPHLAFVLNRKDPTVKYCYCTSTFNQTLLRYTASDCFILRKEVETIHLSDNLSERFKKELIEFIDE